MYYFRDIFPACISVCKDLSSRIAFIDGCELSCAGN